jgi:hypothetical protein
LIEKPFATRDDIVDTFGACSVLNPQKVGALYRDVRTDSPAYRCEFCGVLRVVEAGQLVGDKPGVCTDHAFDAPHVHHIPWQDGLRAVLPAINNRITLHGTAEVELFDRVHALQKRFPKRIAAVEEWPGVDEYDLRIVFADGTAWAIDIKEYANPHDLASQLKPFKGDAEHIRFDRAFYVVAEPPRREYPQYFTDARASASRLPREYELCDGDQFIALVESYRQKKEKRT